MQSNLLRLPLFRNILACLGLIFALTSASSQTLVHSYDGGESASVTAGDTINSITDSAGSTTLTLDGVAGTYSATTAGGGSTLAYSFGGSGAYATAGADSAFVYGNSFIFELQFNASALSSTRGLVYNGNTGGTGIGLYLDGTSLAVLRGSIQIQGIGTVSTGVWNSVALVVDNDNITVYWNGVSSFSTTGSFNVLTGGGSEHLAIGGSGNSGDYFSGYIDNVRLSTFTTGTFNTSMLQYAGTSPVPEPSSYAMIFGFACLALALGCRRAACKRRRA